jgi:hypothetical protein
MFLPATCNKCGRKFFISVRDGSTEDEIKKKLREINVFKCEGHEEKGSPINFLEIDYSLLSNPSITHKYFSEAFKAAIGADEILTRQEFEEKYTVLSDMFQGKLCQSKTDSDDMKIFFGPVTSPDGEEYFYRGGC